LQLKNQHILIRRYEIVLAPSRILHSAFWVYYKIDQGLRAILNQRSMRLISMGRFGVAALAGLLLSVAFAPAEVGGAAWAAPGLMLYCGLGQGGGRAFRLGFTAGFVHFLSSIYWLLAIPYTWHGIPLGPGAGWLALSAYCGLYTGAWVWFCWRIFPANSGDASLPAAVDHFLSTPLRKRIAWAAACAAAWTALEFARGLLFSGFPWNFLGASQGNLVPLIQIASVTGVYGVSFLVAWFSVAVGGVVLALARRPSSAEVWGQAALPLLAVCGVFGCGMTRTMAIATPARELKVALVQPSIPQTLIWDTNANAARFHDVIALSEQALKSAPPPDLLLWPESAVPDMGVENQRAIRELLRQHSAWLIFSGDDAEPGPSGQTAYFNSGFLVSPAGELQAVYHKRRLVIFGEYIPFSRWLPFLKWLTPIDGEFTPGASAVQFSLTNPRAKTSVLICFEDMFPQEARAHVEPDTDFLINLTNDGWFGDGAAQRQQAQGALFRAVENGVPLVRCANNGMTCWIDAQGRIRQVEVAGGGIYGCGFITPQIPLRNANMAGRTIYNRYGDWFSWSCWAVTGLFLLLHKRLMSTV
jgi:apolipoprotein N-acyltransferase